MKNKKRLLLSLCCALMASTAAMGLASCGDRGNTSTPDDVTSSDVVVGFEGGEYYAGGTDEAASGANTLSLTSDGAVTLVIGGTTLTGTYKFENNTFNMTFADSTTAVAILSSGGITLTYNGEAYTFLEKTEYTVSFNVEGAVASTKTVINGRFVTPPADPAKEGNIFVGWYMDAEFKTPFSFASMAVTSDITLYARFVEDADQEFKITFMVDGEVLQVGQTVGGVVVELPTPEKEGSTFMGWWIGDEAGNTSTKYEGNILKENTYLIAVFDNGAPIVSVTATGITWTAPAGVNNSYIVTISLNGVEVDSTTTSMASYDFDFASAAPGEYKIEVTLNGNTGVATYKNKYLAAVSNYQIIGSTLVFNGVENATKYLISFECGSHVHTQEDNGNSTVYDFSACAMKVGGITFKIEAMADGWISSEFTTDPVEKNLSATTITVDKATEVASWTAIENATGYDVSINGTVVATNITATSFDLKGYAPGVLKIEVTAKAHGYNASTSSIDYRKTSLLSPANVKLQDATLTWDAVEGATGYVVKVNDKVLPSVNTNAYTLKDEDLPVGATSCDIQVKALGATADADSLFSDVISVQFGEMSDNIVYANGQVTWDPVLGAKGYEVQNGGMITSIAANENSCAISFMQAGLHMIQVRCIKADSTKSDWVAAYVDVYEVSFDVSGGGAVASVYAAEGDAVQLPTAAKAGYEFAGWFNTPNGTNGIQYETYVQGAANITVYAHWTAKTYIAKLNADVGTLEDEEIEVTFDQHYTLPRPITTSEDLFFGGWYSEPNGRGIKYASDNGESVKVWKDTSDVTLYAYWIDDVLTYKEVVDEENGGTGYAVYGSKNASKLAIIRIPETYKGKAVIAIGSGAFSGSDNLGLQNIVKIEMPDTIQNIDLGKDYSTYSEGSAFRGCRNLREFEVYETAGGHDRHYQSIDGLLVYNAYEGKTLAYYSESLTGTLEIPEGVEVIPGKLFDGADITGVVLPSSLKRIEANAFEDAWKLKTVEFANPTEDLAEDNSNGLVISEYAFYLCTQIESITLPARTLKLADETAADASLPVSFGLIFRSCSNLQNINIAKPQTEGACYYTSNDGMVCVGDELVYCLANREGKVTIPAAVSTIGKEAFAGCERITSVEIHAYVTKIDESAFSGCKGLETVVFQGKAGDAPIDIESKAFYGCSSLKNLSLPVNLGTLKAYAFGVTSSLTDVRVDVGADAVIENAAFGSDSKTPIFNVISLYIGDNVPVLDIAGVFGSEKLLELDIPKTNPNYMLDEQGVVYNKVKVVVDGVEKDVPTKVLFYPVALAAENYVMPNTIEEIGDEVFSGRRFKSITIGEKVTSIGANAFANCEQLETVTFKNADAALAEDGSNGLTIATNAFYYCTALKMVTLPVRLTSIGDTAFRKCESMVGKLVIPANVESVGKQAFYDCSNITEVEVKGEKTLFTYESSKFTTFKGCEELAKIVVAEANQNYISDNGVLYIKANGVASELAYCPALCVGEVVTVDNVSTNTVKVPNTVTTVWANAFAEALEVESVIFLENTAAPVNLALKSGSFAGASGAKLKSVVLPEGMKEIAASSFEKSLITSITIPKSVTLIGNKAFNASKSLTEVIFVEGGTADLKIGTTTTGTSTTNGVFKDCTALASVNLPERLIQLGNGTFYNTAITSINIPARITSLGQGMFTNCSELATVTFTNTEENPGKLTTIGNMVFMGCSALSEIDIPDTVTSMGLNAFNGTSLVNVTLPAELTSLNYSFKEVSTLESLTFAAENKVTSIAKDALSGCTSLMTISIPSNVTSIGDNAFKGCSSLTSVEFKTNADGKTALKSIGASVFAGTALTQFILPETTNSTLTVGGTMFSGCDTITKVSLPKQVSAIGTFFKGCYSITDVQLDGNENLLFEDGIVYNTSKTAIHYVMKDIATTDLVILDNVTQISDYAFANQPSLKTVSIPASIATIGTYAFQNCYNLETVTFRAVEGKAEALTTIPASLFRGCTSLTTIEGLPSTVKTIGNYAFYGCQALSKLNSAEDKNEINLPTALTSLGTDAFSGCSAITAIHIPDGIKALSAQVFQYCTSLSSVTFGEGSQLASIANRAFEYCESLSTFNMPDTVTSIAYGVFASSGIETIHMSTKLTTMSGQDFQYATKLKSITLPEGLLKLEYMMFEGCTSLGAWDEETQAYGKVILPSSLTTINYNVFKDCTSLTEITIPDGVKMLGQANSWSTSRKSLAFSGCTALETVNLGGVTQIGNEAFKDCTSLVNIDLSKVTDMNNNVFENCTSLTSVDLSALKKMQASVFQGCTKLSAVTLGNAVDTIGNYSFANTALTNVKLPATITKISEGLFQGCTNLDSLVYEGKITSIGSYAFEDCVKMTEFVIPSSLTSALGGRVFAGTSITSITLPRAYTKTWGSNNAPFAGCEGLTEILVEGGNPYFESIDGIVYDLDGRLWAVPNGKTFENDTFILPEGTDVDDAAKPFAGCAIGTVILPESMTVIPQRLFDDALVGTVVLGSQVESIGSWAFRNATNMTKLMKKDAEGVAQDSLEGITTIASMAFQGASALEAIVLPNSLTSMSGNAFENAGLTSLTIGSGLTSIPAQAFKGTKITSIEIPSTVTSLGKEAFAGSALTSVKISANISYGANVFQNCVNLANVTFEEGVTTLVNYMFDGCTALTSITLPESLTSMGSYALANTGLTSIVIPASVESIGAYEFFGTPLANVTLKEGLKSISNSAFAGTPLTSVTLPSTVTSIGDLAFADCSKLASINIPAAVTSIGKNAFSGCTSIVSVVIPANTSVGASAFAGWSAEQTVNVALSEYMAVNLLGVDWMANSDAKFVFNYVQA